jgi:ubiquinone/menaquinone biosynthesis C-methylase UbiE
MVAMECVTLPKVAYDATGGARGSAITSQFAAHLSLAVGHLWIHDAPMKSLLRGVFFALALLAGLFTVHGQEQSVKPGINDSFKEPVVDEFVGRFEVESREVFANRAAILKACNIKPGMAVADVGAGTGLFTRLFAEAVGETGRVFAVDIAAKFVAHIEQTARQAGRKNVVGIVGTDRSTELPANSVDLVFICDTYHHFEFPFRTMESVHRALRPGGQVVVIDFHRIEGKSSDWILSHVRAGQEVFTGEIVKSGFRLVGEEPLLKENYFLRFEKVAAPAAD